MSGVKEQANEVGGGLWHSKEDKELLEERKEEHEQIGDIQTKIVELHQVHDKLLDLESFMKFRSGLVVTILAFNVILTIIVLILISLIPYLINT